MAIIITKASGEKTPFSEWKLQQSLSRAGASDVAINIITDKIKSQLYEGMSTKEIYSTAFQLLKKQPNAIAARYNLKRAIMELGPSGFPFEKFYAEILTHQGYTTFLNIIAHGHCINHEIDIIANKGDDYYMLECKFHNQVGYMCDVKIPLYINSRFNDLTNQAILLNNKTIQLDQGWVITNTRFSMDAIKYGECMGLKLIGWDYPPEKSIRESIDSKSLYPITCLTTLSGIEKTKLLEKGIILCKEISAEPTVLSSVGISKNRFQNVIKESRDIIGSV